MWPHLTEFAAAFRRLSAGRPWLSGGMGGALPLRIAEGEKESYARARMGIVPPGREYERFCWMVDAQDDEFMAFHAKRQKAARASDDVALEDEAENEGEHDDT